MSTKTRATIEDLYKVEGKAELVNGEIIEMPPSGDDPSFASGEIFVRLRLYVLEGRPGRAYGDGTGFHVNLPHREAFSPDAAYYTGPQTGMRFLERRSSNRSESQYGQTPSPSTGEGRGGGEARRGSQSPSLPLPPIPTLGATASAQGPLGPFPRQGSSSHHGSSAHADEDQGGRAGRRPAC
jgi:hypothetical protein